MSSVSGPGGTLGGPLQPTVFELQQRGIEDIQKAQLAIVRDTIEIPLTQLGGGAEEVYEKYKSSSSQPVLPPLVQVRMASLDSKEEPLDVTDIYDSILSQLPIELALALEANQMLSPKEQNLNFVALGNVVYALAQTVAFIENAAQPPVEGTLEADRMAIAHSVPYQAVLAALTLNDDLKASLNPILSEMGPNNPNYDTVQNALSEIEPFSSALAALSQQQTVYAGDLVHIAAGLQSIKETLQRDLYDSSFQILGDSIHALSTIVTAYSLGGISPTNLLALEILQTGISGDNGLYTSSVASLIESATSGLQTIFNLKNQSQINLIRLILSNLAIASVLAGTTLGNGIGNFLGQPAEDLNVARRFSTDLAAGLIASSGIIETVLEELVTATGVQQGVVAPLTSVLTLWTLLIGTQAAEIMGNAQANPLLETLQPQLLAHLNTLEQSITTQQENGDLARDVGQGAFVYLIQAKIALQNHDYEAFISSLGALLQLAGVKDDTIKKEMTSITNFGSLAGSALAGELDDQLANFTSISQA